MIYPGKGEWKLLPPPEKVEKSFQLLFFVLGLSCLAARAHQFGLMISARGGLPSNHPTNQQKKVRKWKLNKIKKGIPHAAERSHLAR